MSVRADQIIAGTMMNIAAFGVTGYLNRLIITPSGRGGAGVIAPLTLPDQLTQPPVVGPLLSMFLEQGPIAMSVIVLRRRSLSSRCSDSVGAANPRRRRASEGRRHRRYRRLPQRYLNVIIGCAIAGLAGAYLTLESTGRSRTA